MAKSFVMMGRRRGFRVESEEGLSEWSEVYNAELFASCGPRAPPHGRREDESRRKKRLRKLRKRAQRRNRW